MKVSEHRFHNGNTGAAITVRVTPRSSKNEVFEIMDDGTIKIRLTAPPVEGEANKVLVKFLADILDVAPSRIEIVGGTTSRDKLVAITGLGGDEVQQKILSHIA